MNLSELAKVLKPVRITGELPAEFKNIQPDSRLVGPGDVFIAIPGLTADGNKFVPAALKNGAIAVITEAALELPVPTIVVSDARKSLGRAAAWFYDYPAQKLQLVGITGTNGKTTISYLVKAIWDKAGWRTGLIGSIKNYLGSEAVPSHFTTPEALELEELLAKMAAKQLTHVVLEVSSHALALERVNECPFHAAIFTNLTHDHLDFHKNFERYQQSKARLFNELLRPQGYKIINRDDKFGLALLQEPAGDKHYISYGLSELADVWADKIEMRFDGTSFYLVTKDIRQHIELPLIGLFNVYNTLAAIAYCLSVGIDLEIIVEAVEEFGGVPGRLQMIECGQDFKVIIDYAHTPDSLEQTLKTIKALSRGRLFTVFGCTGDRDPVKRPIMGDIASQWSDYFYITSDDPHTEEPMGIIKEIEKGAIDRGKLRQYDYMLEIDRFKAISMALKKAGKGDVVFIAGKGHEAVQIFKDKTVPYSDEKAVREILAYVVKK